MRRRDRRLLIAIHDVTPATYDRVVYLIGMLRNLRKNVRYTLLVTPDHWHRDPMEASPVFCRWLRAEAARGTEIFLHGLYHVQERPCTSGGERLRARLWTAGEGEFLCLDENEAASRLAEGRQRLEAVIGRSVTGFVAPAWLYGPGTRRALRAEGFEIAEDRWSVWSPVLSRRLAWSPVIAYSSRSRLRVGLSVLWSRMAEVLLSGVGWLRIGLHPADVSRPALLDELARLLAHQLVRREVTPYGALLAEAGNGGSRG